MNPVDTLTSASINSLSFELLKNKKAGRMKFILRTRGDSGEERLKFSIPIASIWVDKQLQAIRCFATSISRRNKYLLRVLEMFGMLTTESHGMVLYGADSMICYGPRPGDHVSQDDESWDTKTYYRNKADILKAMVSMVNRYHQVAGFENLNVVPDVIMKQFGFEEVSEYFGRGMSMWCANINSVIGGNDRYGSSVRKKALVLLRIMQYVVEKRDLKELTMKDLIDE